MTDLPEVRHARITWRCRRGMRELDLLLEKFLLSGLTSRDDDDLDRLEHLLTQPDQDILAWLTSAVSSEDGESRRIVTGSRRSIYPPPNAHE